MSWFFISVFFVFLFCSCSNSSTTDPLDVFTRDVALKTLAQHRPHTGAVYRVLLPANLSSMEVFVEGIRSRRLWNRGAEKLGCFHIPSRTKPMPHVKRLALVYQDLGNLSSQFYRLPGYSFLTSVVGFLVYDATHTSLKSAQIVGLNTMGKSILIQFPNLTSEERLNSNAKCASFAASGTVYLSDMIYPGICNTTGHGHFSIVVPVKKKPLILRYSWVVAIVLGVLAAILGCYLGMVCMRHRKRKKFQDMEEQADDDSVLENRWVRGSKMPSGGVTRTQPVSENGFQHLASPDHFI
ncbi:hypothetical protein RchiOBHm_Chr7g0195831 [Rosa chinensis]|uniref:Non-specific serine/threonine protein kinase n=1 Tax=Rosa chinensis TaxID=74649 RepID=A0A2P6P6G9_ROSCH|nr:uncharacterized protein LOC112177437 [Rosa chinensis]PRQ17516.1 hypothetical protein RchiOBHm_Chr7g0195831 [Rosa chinensis]